MSDHPRMPKAPRRVAGVENRRRTRRDGETYWTFRVRWTDPVTGRRVAEEFDRQQDAIDFHASLRLARRRGVLDEFDRGRQTLAEFVEHEWWPNDASVNLTRPTLPTYASIYNRHVLPRVGHLELRQIKPPTVRKLREDLERAACSTCDGHGTIRLSPEGRQRRVCHACRGRRTLGPATVVKALTILQAVCRYAVERGELASNPVKDVSKPAVDRQLAIVAVAPAQVEQLLAHLDPAGAALCTLIAYEGLRPGEALALEERHLGQQSVLVEQKNVKGTIVPGVKTSSRSRSRDGRSPTLFAPVRQDLAAYRLATPRLPDSTGRRLLFARADGEAWTDPDYRNWRRRHFKRAVEAAGLPITRPYDLRHACASLLIRAGWPLTDVADHMGHTVQTLARDYAHVIAELRGQPTVEPEQAILAARDARARRAG